MAKLYRVVDTTGWRSDEHGFISIDCPQCGTDNVWKIEDGRMWMIDEAGFIRPTTTGDQCFGCSFCDFEGLLRLVDWKGFSVREARWEWVTDGDHEPKAVNVQCPRCKVEGSWTIWDRSQVDPSGIFVPPRHVCPGCVKKIEKLHLVDWKGWPEPSPVPIPKSHWRILPGFPGDPVVSIDCPKCGMGDEWRIGLTSCATIDREGMITPHLSTWQFRCKAESSCGFVAPRLRLLDWKGWPMKSVNVLEIPSQNWAFPESGVIKIQCPECGKHVWTMTPKFVDELGIVSPDGAAFICQTCVMTIERLRLLDWKGWPMKSEKFLEIPSDHWGFPKAAMLNIQCPKCRKTIWSTSPDFADENGTVRPEGAAFICMDCDMRIERLVLRGWKAIHPKTLPAPGCVIDIPKVARAGPGSGHGWYAAQNAIMAQYEKCGQLFAFPKADDILPDGLTLYVVDCPQQDCLRGVRFRLLDWTGWPFPVEKKDEKVHHPSHYGGDTVYEAIKVIEAWGLGFCLGNTVKYICRTGKKDPKAVVEDLRKAAWYLNREIERLVKENA